MAALMPQGKQQYFTAGGIPLVGGKVYTYAAGTTTPLATYTTAAASTPNANPVILDSRGEASIFFSAANYKIVVKDSLDSTIWTQDNLPGDAAASVLASLAASTGSSLVGHIASGTGAVATTVQSKLRESVSVLDFGVVGDGLDESVKIQAAITAAEGKSLYIPKGSGAYYAISSGLIGVSNVHIYGEGTIKNINTSATANIDILTFTGCSNFSVSGITFIGPSDIAVLPGAAWGIGGASLVLKDCNNFSIHDNKFQKHNTDGIFVESTTVESYKGHIYNNDFTLGTTYTPSFIGSISGTTLTVTSILSGILFPSVSIFGSGVATGTMVSEQLTGTTNGVGTYTVTVSQTVAPTTMTVFAQGYLGEDIRVQAHAAYVRDIIVSNNSMRSTNSMGIIVCSTATSMYSAYNIAIKDNVVTNKKFHGILYWYGNKTDTNVGFSIQVTGNTVQDINWIGIYSAGASQNIRISGNLVKNCCLYVPRTTASYTYVLDCACITLNGGIGPYAHKHIEISGNLISAWNGFSGIHINEGDAITITNNTLVGNSVALVGHFNTGYKEGAIRLFSVKNLSITSNVIKLNSVEGWGIYQACFVSACNGTLIANNTIIDAQAGTAGIWIAGGTIGNTNVLISDNIIKSSSIAQGIHIDALVGSVTINNNNLIETNPAFFALKIRVENTKTSTLNNLCGTDLLSGSFSLSAAASTVVANNNYGAVDYLVTLQPANAAAATLMQSTKSLWVDANAAVLGTSFTVKTADGAAATGTEMFYYTIRG